MATPEKYPRRIYARKGPIGRRNMGTLLREMAEDAAGLSGATMPHLGNNPLGRALPAPIRVGLILGATAAGYAPAKNPKAAPPRRPLGTKESTTKRIAGGGTKVQPGNFVPTVRLDPSQVRDVRRVQGPVDMRKPLNMQPPPRRPTGRSPHRIESRVR